MKVAILGGGFAGLSAAFYLQKKGHSVTLFEREKVLGGLAVGFKEPGWDWPLERAYHHLFATDSAILGLAKDTDFNGIFYQSPETASLYKVGNNYRSFPVDTPQDFMKFPLLSLFEKVRVAMVLVFLKLSPSLSMFDKDTSVNFFSKIMGKRAWKTIFGQVMRKKFGKYAENILASFIWARVKVRTKSLGYIKGGFQTFTEHLEKVNSDLGVSIKSGHEVQKIEKQGEGYIISYGTLDSKTESADFDAVISTLPSPILARTAGHLFPAPYFEKFKKLKYLNAVVLIVESNKPLLDKTYWLSICDPEIPTMFIGQHTNFIDKRHYGGKHIAYIGWYITPDDKLWTMDEKQILNYIAPHLKKISPSFEVNDAKTHIFKAPFAQPIFDKDFLENKPTFETPLKNFYIANLDMTYPNDRGTNFAVALGKKVSELLEFRSMQEAL